MYVDEFKSNEDIEISYSSTLILFSSCSNSGDWLSFSIVDILVMSILSELDVSINYNYTTLILNYPS